MIINDDDLRARIATLNSNLQEIQNYIGSDDPDQYDTTEFKIRFPHGYLRTAAQFRLRLSFIVDDTLRTNMAYSLIEADLLTWLINRTRITGTLKEMLIKSGIIKMGALAEAGMRHRTRGRINKDLNFKPRCRRMVSIGIIDQDLCDDLEWLWDTRGNIHLYLLGDVEYHRYTERDYDRAFNITRRLFESLST